MTTKKASSATATAYAEQRIVLRSPARLTILAASSALALGAPGAKAQSTNSEPPPAPAGATAATSSPLIHEVVVIARRVSENIQKVPETVTAVSAQGASWR
jgi:hypothetical protein